MREQVGPEPYGASQEAFQETLTYCRLRAPELVAEMIGIGEGAAVACEDIFCINAHLDLLNWKHLVWGRCTDHLAGGCSSHAVATPAGVLLGWNGDDWRGWLDCGAVIRGRPDGGEPFLYWSLAGSVGRPGMNRHLALGANSLPSPRFRLDGLLYPMICRKLLACRSTREAVAVFHTHNRCSAMNYLVADRRGELLDIESTPDDWVTIPPVEEGNCRYLLHTNSYLHAGLGRTKSASAVCPRLASARRLYREHAPRDAVSLRAALSDHSGGICVHTPESCTVVSFVAELETARFHVTRGNPCEAPVQTHLLELP
jgi:isopenicillin-N N-acyltransferase-like protein